MLGVELIEEFERRERIMYENTRRMQQLILEIKQRFFTEPLRSRCLSCAGVQQECNGCPVVKLQTLLQ